jgi:hypothetical protein
MNRTPKCFALAVPVLAAALATTACGGVPGSAAPGGAVAEVTATSATRSACRAPLPSATLEVPPGNELEFQLAATGFQIYACTATAAGPAWVFKAPEADLFDRTGALAGTHFAGPTWKALDGSSVVGARVAGFTPDPASIPWLLLSAASHAGDGRMEEVTYIQRVATVGGLAPAVGCDEAAAAAGAVARVPYTAIYCFSEAR